MDSAVTLQPLCAPPSVADPFGPPGRHTYVVEPLKILYVSVPKNACTRLKSLILTLAGEDLSSYQPDLARSNAVHLRSAWRTPRLDQIDPEVRRTISPANGWFVFAVVRDPRARLFSAWQDKLLMHPAYGYREWKQADWYPRVPESPDDVVRDFARFVEVLRTEPDHPLARDPHFSAQTELVCPDAMSYSRLYNMEEMPTLLADLAVHLRTQGVDHDMTRPQTKESLLRANGRVLAGPVRFQIEQMYAADFDNFGHMWDYGKIENAGEWTLESVQKLRARILLNNRIGGLVDIGIEQRARAQLAEAQLKRTEGQLRRTEGQLIRTESQLERRERRLSRSEHQLKRTEGRLRRSEGRLNRTEGQLNRVRQRAARAENRVARLESMRSTRIGLAARALRRRLLRIANGG